MDIRQLWYFILVAKHLNFTAASKEAHIDQSSLSRHIADLETRIGLKLFVRNTRSVQLTAAGAELLKHAHEIIDMSEHAINQARLAAKGSIGNLQIGFVGSMEKDKLPEAVKNFRSDYPKVNLSVLRFNLGPLNSALAKGKLDLAFTFSYGLENISGLVWENCPFYPNPTPICVVVPLEHPLAGKNKVNLHDVAGDPFVVLSRDEDPDSYDHMEKLCLAHGFYPNIVCEAPMLENLLLLVETGIGITVLSKHTQIFANSKLRFIEIENYDYYIHRVAAWREDNSNPLIPLFLESVRK